MIIAALAMISGSAYAADWNFYGSARMYTFYNAVDDGANPSVDTKNTQWSLSPYSRIGANVKVSDELSGRFEYGASGGNANIRLLYGVWNFGAGTLLVGQDYTPVRFPGSNQAWDDAGLGGWGELSSSRAGQIKLRFGDFQMAAVVQNVKYTTAGGTTAALATEVKLPALSAKYRFVGENYAVGVVGAYGTFKETTTNDSVNSYVLGIGGDVTFGAITLGANVHGGVNSGNLMSINVTDKSISTGDDGNGYADLQGTKIIDNDALGFKFTAAYAVNDMFGLEAGYGVQQTELDQANSQKLEVASYYLQAPITMAPGVIIVPEIGVIDYNEANEDKITYFGAKWQINF